MPPGGSSPREKIGNSLSGEILEYLIVGHNRPDVRHSLRDVASEWTKTAPVQPSGRTIRCRADDNAVRRKNLRALGWRADAAGCPPSAEFPSRSPAEIKLTLGRQTRPKPATRGINWRTLRQPDEELALVLAIPIGTWLATTVLVSTGPPGRLRPRTVPRPVALGAWRAAGLRFASSARIVRCTRHRASSRRAGHAVKRADLGSRRAFDVARVWTGPAVLQGARTRRRRFMAFAQFRSFRHGAGVARRD
jgi:hypothetical protein